MFRGLSAGGKWIRTFGPPVRGTTLSRLPQAPPSRFIADSLLKEGHSEASLINADASYRPHRPQSVRAATDDRAV